MINTKRPDQLWLLGGAGGAVVILALGWFLLIGPQYAEAAELDGQATEAQGRVATLQQRLVELRKQNENLPLYQEQLVTARKALPTTPALADLLRELQTGGDSAGVVVSALTFGAAVPVTPGSQTSALPISLTAAGTVAKLLQFLNQLQQVQPRAVLIGTVSLDAAAAASVTLSLTLQVFVAAE